jgi:predicted component of type VI protein secretion system
MCSTIACFYKARPYANIASSSDPLIHLKVETKLTTTQYTPLSSSLSLHPRPLLSPTTLSHMTSLSKIMSPLTSLPLSPLPPLPARSLYFAGANLYLPKIRSPSFLHHHSTSRRTCRGFGVDCPDKSDVAIEDQASSSDTRMMRIGLGGCFGGWHEFNSGSVEYNDGLVNGGLEDSTESRYF